VLDAPGSADLSVWVDFGALRQAAMESGAPVTCHGPVTQQHFLSSMGVGERLQQLLKVNVDPTPSALLTHWVLSYVHLQIALQFEPSVLIDYITPAHPPSSK
jgi:SAM-dependent MidA family methyltransferase